MVKRDRTAHDQTAHDKTAHDKTARDRTARSKQHGENSTATKQCIVKTAQERNSTVRNSTHMAGEGCLNDKYVVVRLSYISTKVKSLSALQQRVISQRITTAKLVSLTYITLQILQDRPLVKCSPIEKPFRDDCTISWFRKSGLALRKRAQSYGVLTPTATDPSLRSDKHKGREGRFYAAF